MKTFKAFTAESSGIALAGESVGRRVYQVNNQTGEGTMTVYEVFPGAVVMYNDFHIAYYDSDFQPQQDWLCIDYCRDGRMEYAVGEDACSYVEAGDLKLDRRLEHQGRFVMPLAHYHGVSIGLYLPDAAGTLERLMEGYPFDLYALREKFCPGARPRVLHGATAIDHIFQGLYAVPERIRLPYYKVKIWELFLTLDALELPEGAEKPYFYRPQVEAVKAVRAYLTEHLDERWTLEALSARYQIPLTTLKACFKAVFGSPLHTYMRTYRMDRAASLLRDEPGTSVTEIAGRVGYDSASKFSAAFKAVKGKTPKEYRKER